MRWWKPGTTVSVPYWLPVIWNTKNPKAKTKTSDLSFPSLLTTAISSSRGPNAVF